MSLTHRSGVIPSPDWPDRWRHVFDADWDDAGWVRLEEYREGGDLVIRAELPGVDPDRDVEVRVAHGVLHIDARRRERIERREHGHYHSEFRYGAQARQLALPDGALAAQASANYSNGILEIRIPLEPSPATSVVNVPVGRG